MSVCVGMHACVRALVRACVIEESNKSSICKNCTVSCNKRSVYTILSYTNIITARSLEISCNSPEKN